MPTHLITGAGRGIGLELARQLSARGDTVLALIRSPRPALEALDNVEIYDGVDVTDSVALSTISGRLQGRRIDTLIHNAGVLRQESLDNLNI